MNKTALKNFATNARKELLKKVEAKAFKIGITEENIKKAQFETSDVIYIDGKQLSITEKKQRDKLIQRIKEIGFKRVVEEVAYTWFNRFIALRFMEVNNYLPTKVRVLSSSNPDSPEPDIIREALSVDLDIDKELVYELKINSKTEELFKYLIIKQCNSLNKCLPFMFETIEDYKEILFPEGLLAKDSFLREITDTEVIPEFDWQKVEIIGWLYQYYIAEEKDRVIKAKKKYKSEEIPYATQLFTPDWIVRYMVQNTLGRYWVESHPEHRDLISNWEFYLDNPKPEPDFEEKLAPFINKELKVEEIKCFDPAMGSGHILVYMFDVLFEIYSKCGYMEREIPRLIIENNLYGLDIDDRAYQLACFSVVMKAMEYNKRFFRSIEREGLKLNLASIQETNILNDEDIAYIAEEGFGANFENIKDFIEQFKDSKYLGSLIKINSFDKELLLSRSEIIKENPATDLFDEQIRQKVVSTLPKLIKQAEIMERKYDILITNPPYVGNKYLSTVSSDYLNEWYSEGKADLFSAFMVYSFMRVKENGQIGFMTPFVWMFISSFEELRNKLIRNKNISSLIQLEYSGFDEATVPICTFTLRNYYVDIPGEFIKLSDFKGAKNQPIMALNAVKNPNVPYRYRDKIANLKNIPGSPIAYWSSYKIREAYKSSSLIKDLANTRKGMATGFNAEFVRCWYEVELNKIGFDLDRVTAKSSNKKWFPYANGGEYRKWYGNYTDVVNWENDGYRLQTEQHESGRIRAVNLNLDYIFREGLTWTSITSSNFSIRLLPKGFLFSSASNALFANEKVWYFLGLLNSNVHKYLSKIINPTLNANPGDISKIPIVFSDRINKNLIDDIIELAKKDWDSFEISWNFTKHPILIFKNGSRNIKQSFNNWSICTDERFNKMKTMETELNKIFIDVYDLKEELSHEVEENDITINMANKEKDIKSFISYSVGCMLGRYSLDEEGIVFAGGKFEPEKYQTFSVDKDNILPILSGAYFEDDIVSRFVEFVKVTFAEETLEENLEFIANSLGKRDGETAKETIRRYFLNDFYKDHVQMYKKRPIYWLFTSGKHKAFNCLIYMHRYDKSTLSRIRTDYLHELQNRLDIEKKSLLSIIEGDGTAKEISNAKKELKSLDLKIEELKAYDELLHHMADMQIEIDLDDGVAVNYAKYNGLLAKLD